MISYEENGQVNMEALEIADVVDISLLQRFQDNFAISINCASVTVDRHGDPITQPSSYTKFCTNFIHRSAVGDRRCAESHNRMGQEAASTGRPCVGTCHAGLIDFAAPIIVNGELLGTVLGGQVLDQPPKENVLGDLDVTCFYQSLLRNMRSLTENAKKIKNKIEKNTKMTP